MQILIERGMVRTSPDFRSVGSPRSATDTLFDPTSPLALKPILSRSR